MLSVSDRLLQLLAWRPRRTPLADRALAVVRDRFSPCSACRGSLHRHLLAKLASVFVGDGSAREQELEGLVSTQQWERASEYQDWSSDRAVRKYHLIRCPQKSQIVLIRVLSTPEMWTDDRVDTKEVLNQRDYEAILGIIGDKWLTL